MDVEVETGRVREDRVRLEGRHIELADQLHASDADIVCCPDRRDDLIQELPGDLVALKEVDLLQGSIELELRPSANDGPAVSDVLVKQH